MSKLIRAVPNEFHFAEQQKDWTGPEHWRRTSESLERDAAMNKRDALRLKAGDKILLADSKSVQEVTNWWTGEVKHVTERGGVLVHVTSARDGGWDNPPGKGTYVGTQRWVPYHFICKQPK